MVHFLDKDGKEIEHEEDGHDDHGHDDHGDDEDGVRVSGAMHLLPLLLWLKKKKTATMMHGMITAMNMVIKS